MNFGFDIREYIFVFQMYQQSNNFSIKIMNCTSNIKKIIFQVFLKFCLLFIRSKRKILKSREIFLKDKKKMVQGLKYVAEVS